MLTVMVLLEYRMQPVLYAQAGPLEVVCCEHGQPGLRGSLIRIVEKVK